MKFQKLAITSLSLMFLFSSCMSNEEFKSTLSQEVSPQFLTKNKNISTSDPSDKWWLEFNDELLNQLIEIGLRNNRDIAISNMSIITSRQLNNINITNLLPLGSASVARQRFSSPGFGPNGVRYDLFQATFDATWELDFFGKNLDRYKAGKLRFLKEAQLYKANTLRVVSEISQNYVALKSLQKQIENLEKISQLRDSLTKIASKKEQNGTASKINIHNAEIDFDSASSALIQTHTDEKVLTYKLAVLLGVTPEKIVEILDNPNRKEIFDYSSGLVPVGLKSDVLNRRPDVSAAAYEVDAALFDKSAQFKEFLPSFNLTAKLGGGAQDLGQMLKNGTNIKDLRGAISVPIFSVGQLMAEYKISKATAKIAVLNYEKTVLSALQDCESQLIRYVNSLEIENNTNHSRQANAKILQINLRKKSVGAIASEELLKSQISDLNSEIQLAQKKADSLINLIALHKSIGGGFEGFEMHFDKDQVSWVQKSKDKI